MPPLRWATRLVLCLVLLISAAAGVRAQGLAVTARTLKNGMKILVHEDHSIPSIALYISYRIGTRNEGPGTTGLSHFFEHMMFNGARKYGPKQFDVVMEAAGGANNAYTTRDVTVYQDWFPPSILDLIFDMEADRIEYLSFDPKMIESERGVVASERRTSVDSDNFGLLDEALWASAFAAHPYQWPILGWMVDIENWTIQDLKNHFAKGYSPSNATLVVAGDTTAEAVMRLAQKYFEPIPTHAPPAKVTTREPEQLGEKRVTVKKFAQLPLLMLGYHIPETAHADFYPLEVLETILFTGQSSRMYQRLVDKDQLALFVSGDFSYAFDPTLFTITSQPKAGIALAAVEGAIYEELDRLKREPVSARELEKAKNILQSTFFRRMKTINGKASLLGSYEVFFGDYRRLFAAADSYSKVTKEEVMKVAQKYFSDRNRTVATLIPENPASGR